MSTMRQMARLVSDLMEELGVTHWEVVQGGKHQRLEMVVAGRRTFYTLPVTPSDHRAWLNIRAGIRRLVRNPDAYSRRT